LDGSTLTEAKSGALMLDIKLWSGTMRESWRQIIDYGGASLDLPAISRLSNPHHPFNTVRRIDVTVIKKNYLAIGGHHWIKSVGEPPNQGGFGNFCSKCGVGAMINGGHGKCPPATPTNKAE